jgi:hypothetical protein
MKIIYRIVILSQILILFLITESFPQSASPYSRLGIGEINYANSARKLGIGEVGVADAPEYFISIYNPAGLYNLKSTRIEFDLTYRGSFLSNDNISAYSGKGEFGGFMIGLPISEKYGIGAIGGILPYSNVSYNVNISSRSQNEDYEAAYSGRGGLSKLFIGSSYKLPFDLVIGATFEYYFGSTDYTSTINFLDNSLLFAQYTNEYRPKGIGTTLGLISPDLAPILNIDAISDFRLGFTYNHLSELRTDTVFTTNTVLGIDTLSTGIVKMKIPGRISAGVSMVFSKKYLVNMDYVFQAWDNYLFDGRADNNLRNSTKISVGFEYLPERLLGSSFWEQIILRAGLSYEQTQFLVNKTGVNQYSVSGGFSIPLSPANTLDLGLQYGIRPDPGFFKENLLKVYLTVSLGDIWFIREEK